MGRLSNPPEAIDTIADQGRSERQGPRRASQARPVAAETGCHRRLLGNGHCTRPAALDCNFETICERCGFFDTGPQFIPILRRQRDHATERDQHDRARIFTGLLDGIDNAPPDMLE